MRIELVAPNEEQRIRRGRSTNVDRLTTRTQAIYGGDLQPVASASGDWNDVIPHKQVWKAVPCCQTERFASGFFQNLLKSHLFHRNTTQPYEQDPYNSAGSTGQQESNYFVSSAYTYHNNEDPVFYDSGGFVSYAIGVNQLNFPFAIDRKTSLIPDPKIKVSKFRKFAHSMTFPFTSSKGEICRGIPFAIGTSDIAASSVTSMVVKMTASRIVVPIREVEYCGDSRMRLTAVLSSETSIEKMSESLSALCISDSILFQGMVMNKLMDEILIASKILTGRYYEVVGLRNNEVVCATKLLYFGIHRVINSCQSFSHFRDLSSENQQTLIKSSCTEMLLLRSLYHVNLELDAWIFHSPSKVRIQRVRERKMEEEK